MSSDASLVFAQNKHGELVSINDVANGLACECSCPFCDTPVIARNNSEKRTSHFAHQSRDSNAVNLKECSYEFWRSLHYLSFLSLQKNPVIRVPESIVSERRDVNGKMFSEQVLVEKTRLERLKSVELVRVKNRRLMDIVVTMSSGEKVIIYPNVPVSSSSKNESDINKNPDSWRGMPVMMIRFGDRFRPQKNEAFPLAAFLSRLHDGAKREWHIEPEIVSEARKKIVQKADEWSEAVVKSEKEDMMLFAKSWINQTPISLSDVASGLKRPVANDNSGSILRSAKVNLSKLSHLFLVAETVDSNGNGIVLLFTEKSSYLAPKGLSGKAVINIVIDKHESPEKWTKTWLKLPSEAKIEIENAKKESIKHLLDVPIGKFVDDFYESSIKSTPISQLTWDAFLAQGFVSKEDGRKAIEWLSLASKLIQKDVVKNNDAAVSLVKKALVKGDSWSTSLVATMNYFGSMGEVINSLSDDEQFSCMLLSIGDKSPGYCTVFIPLLEKFSKQSIQSSIKVLIPPEKVSSLAPGGYEIA
jgi:hypothetical protein